MVFFTNRFQIMYIKNLLGRAPMSSVQTMVQDDPIARHLNFAAQASTSGRCKADLARIKEDLACVMKTKLGVNMDNSRLYQKPYPSEFDLVFFLLVGVFQIL